MLALIGCSQSDNPASQSECKIIKMKFSSLDSQLVYYNNNLPNRIVFSPNEELAIQYNQNSITKTNLKKGLSIQRSSEFVYDSDNNLIEEIRFRSNANNVLEIYKKYVFSYSTTNKISSVKSYLYENGNYSATPIENYNISWNADNVSAIQGTDILGGSQSSINLSYNVDLSKSNGLYDTRLFYLLDKGNIREYGIFLNKNATTRVMNNQNADYIDYQFINIVNSQGKTLLNKIFEAGNPNNLSWNRTTKETEFIYGCE